MKLIKSIRSQSDLAINGRPPAFKQPVHVGRPNICDREGFLRRVEQIIDSRWLTNNGSVVQEFERRIAEHVGVKHCVAMCNGTIALEIAIRALGLEGEVIVPSWTFVATAHALYWQGITPVFADIDAVTHNLDPVAVRRMITSQTTGIIAVHLWGRAAPVDQLQSLADEYGLKLMFDAAHAFGCSYKGQTIGQFGACEIFSFHATKAFNSMEGGAVTTNDDSLARSLRLMRNFGFDGYDNVVYPGTNGKMTEVCAAMGLSNLEGFDDVVAINRRNYRRYAAALASLEGIRLLQYRDAETPNYQYVVVEMDEEFPADRDDLIRALHAENILARKYFWPGCHAMQAYRDENPAAADVLPVTCHVADRVIVLPTGKSLPDGAIDTIASVFAVMGAQPAP